MLRKRKEIYGLPVAFVPEGVTLQQMWDWLAENRVSLWWSPVAEDLDRAGRLQLPGGGPPPSTRQFAHRSAIHAYGAVSSSADAEEGGVTVAEFVRREFLRPLWGLDLSCVRSLNWAQYAGR